MRRGPCLVRRGQKRVASVRGARVLIDCSAVTPQNRRASRCAGPSGFVARVSSPLSSLTEWLADVAAVHVSHFRRRVAHSVSPPRDHTRHAGTKTASKLADSIRSRRWFPQQSSPNRPKHGVHHRWRQFAGVCVLATRVIAADQGVPVRQSVREAVSERRTRPEEEALEFEEIQVRVEPDLAERHDDRHVRERREFSIEMRQAVREISSGVGLFAGGAQRTAARMNASRNANPSSR